MFYPFLSFQNALTNAAVLTKILSRVTLDPHQERKVNFIHVLLIVFYRTIYKLMQSGSINIYRIR